MLSKYELIYSINKFESWLENFGEFSYDRFDFWSSNIGKIGKQIFYKNKIMGFPFALGGLLLENFFPNVQKLFSKPHREAIADAHFALAYFNLYEHTGNKKYLIRGEHFLEILKKTYSKGYSGYAWGYTFGWQQSKNGYWDAGIPLITVTPYAFWAFKKHYELTKVQNSKDIVLSVANFALNDLNEIRMPNGTFCASYSPISKDIVINANTYRAALLLDAYKIFRKPIYKTTANRNIEFVLSYQGEKGEWYYEAKGPKNNFIDNFHTCIILRNLYYCYIITNDKKILEAIKKGYIFYINNLFYKNGRPKHFALSKFPKMRKYEMYDYAEGITLGILLSKNIPEALNKSFELARDLIQNFQTKEGYFITRVTSLSTIHKVPYLRWPQAQLFYALTSLLKESQ